MNMLLPDLKTVFARLQAMDGVTKVIAGSVSQAPHSYRPGELKFVRREGSAANVRAYSGRGMQTFHVYAKDLDNLEKSLNRAPDIAHAQGRDAVKPLPPESNIERKAKQQPVYPAVPTPQKSAAPVKHTDVRGMLVTITPEIAINWLERNSRNRPLRDSDVKKYANDMRAGRWMPGGVIIKFDKNGTIVNGQHTLWAIVESGVSIEAYVLMGVDPDVVLVEDDHARRRLTDVIRITHPGSHASSLHTAVGTLLRASMAWHRGESGTQMHITRQQEMAFLEEYWEPIDFAVRAFSSKGNRRGISVSSVMTPLARAWFTENRERLQQFAAAVLSGMVDDTKRDRAAILLRNYLLGSDHRAGTMLLRQGIYRRVERALRAYLDGQDLQQLKPVGEELFRLPGERKAPKSRATEAE